MKRKKRQKIKKKKREKEYIEKKRKREKSNENEEDEYRIKKREIKGKVSDYRINHMQGMICCKTLSKVQTN